MTFELVYCPTVLITIVKFYLLLFSLKWVEISFWKCIVVYKLFLSRPGRIRAFSLLVNDMIFFRLKHWVVFKHKKK